MRNKNLEVAKKQKNDEFYTCRESIEAELMHYKKHFNGKIVYCNCDDPKESEFWKFFVRVFKDWGIKKLMATHYEPDEKNFTYKLEISDDVDVTLDVEPIITPLPCNGDFRNSSCIELLKEADIVVTNPPFSLFREYVAQLMEYDKKFLIIGNSNAVTYKDVFPLIKDNRMWLGYNNFKTMEFIMPDSYKITGKGFVDEEGKKHGFVPNISWFTNLEVSNRSEDLDLRGNYYNPDDYPYYENYNAIEVSKVNNIPCDFAGMMGVPISFLGKYNPEQFEILGYSLDLATPIKEVAKKTDVYKTGGNAFYIRESENKLRRLYVRIVVRNKKVHKK